MKEKPRNGNMPRVLRPSMRLYFIVILLFAAAAVVMRYWILGAAEFLCALIL